MNETDKKEINQLPYVLRRTVYENLPRDELVLLISTNQLEDLKIQDWANFFIKDISSLLKSRTLNDQISDQFYDIVKETIKKSPQEIKTEFVQRFEQKQWSSDKLEQFTPEFTAINYYIYHRTVFGLYTYGSERFVWNWADLQIPYSYFIVDQKPEKIKLREYFYRLKEQYPFPNINIVLLGLTDQKRRIDQKQTLIDKISFFEKVVEAKEIFVDLYSVEYLTEADEHQITVDDHIYEIYETDDVDYSSVSALSDFFTLSTEKQSINLQKYGLAFEIDTEDAFRYWAANLEIYDKVDFPAEIHSQYLQELEDADLIKRMLENTFDLKETQVTFSTFAEMYLYYKTFGLEKITENKKMIEVQDLPAFVVNKENFMWYQKYEEILDSEEIKEILILLTDKNNQSWGQLYQKNKEKINKKARLFNLLDQKQKLDKEIQTIEKMISELD